MDTMLPSTKQAGTVLFFKRILAIFLFIYAIFSGSLLAQDRQIVYNTPGTYTWTPPCGVTNIRIFVWGAGGAGGGANNSNRRGGGGGAGAFLWHYNLPVAYGTTYSIIVGEGGEGDGGDDGENGENSTFRIQGGTILMRAQGGRGGKVNGNGGVKGQWLDAAPGSWTINNLWGEGAGANSGATYGGGGGASGSPNFNQGVNATGSAGAIAALGAYPGTNGGNGGNGQTGDGRGDDGYAPGGGGGGGQRTGGSNRRGGHGADGQIIIEYNGVPNGYCNKTFSTVEPITNVTFAGINNTTIPAVNGTPALEKFCPPINASVARGSTYSITVKGNTDGDYTNYFWVYIDWDQDGSFESTELYDIGTITNSTGVDAQTATTNITVPGTALLGKTMMRVLKNYNNNSNACSNATYGQAEDYEVLVNGACQQPTGATANGTASSITICAGTQVILRQTGGTLSPDQQWEWTKTNCTAVYENRNTNSDAAYTFTPLGTGSTTFYVKAIGGSCGSSGPCQSVTVNVIAPGTISVNPVNGNNFSVCRNIANATMATFAVGGGATSVTPSGLPAGIMGTLTGTAGNYTYTLGGTPTAAIGTYNYTLTLNPQTPCAVTSISGTITITDTTTISYSGSPFVFCQNSVITPAVPTVNDGGLTTTYAVVGTPLPPGLTLNTTTGIISGTPTVLSGATNYTIRATNGCGFTDVVINISVVLGNTLFNITPNGSQTICSSSPGIAIGLDGSDNTINYRLYRDGSQVGGDVVGDGNPIAFGTHNTAGTYTIVAVTGCATNMNGSLTLSVTPQPTATFSYASSAYCKGDINPTPTISGVSAAGATFSASPAGLNFANASTGEINLATSNPGTYSITYSAPASGGCTAYSYTSATQITIITSPSVYTVTGGGKYCSGGAGVPVGLNWSQTSINYQLYRDGIAVGSTVPGTNAALSFGNQTVAGTYSVKAVAGTCVQDMDGEVDVEIKPLPAAIAVTPVSKTICQGTVVPIVAALAPPSVTTTTNTINSGGSDMNLSIPGNSATGVAHTLRVTGVPAGATINWISINFYVTHSYVGDLRLNLKGPNGNVLNIVNRRGGDGNNFGTASQQTTVASNGSTNIANIVANDDPFNTATYLPEALGGIQGGTVVSNNLSNVTDFSGLYNAESFSTNGNWILSVSDHASGDNGELERWAININYSTVAGQADVTWASALDLFTDPSGIIPYTPGTALKTIYAKPQIFGSDLPVTATLTNNEGCFTTATSLLTVNQAPQINITADYCNTEGTPGTVLLTATSDMPISSWIWSTASVGLSGNTATTSYIEVNTAGNYFVTGVSSLSTCTGSDVMKISQELIYNGNFELGNVGFTSEYYYQADVAGNTELWDHNANGGTNGYGVGTNAQNYHSNFWGVDHTTGTGAGNFMIVNGHGTLEIWKQEGIPVVPLTTYYFSGYGLSLNSSAERAKLQFEINDAPIGSELHVATGVNNNGNNNWGKFWGQWTAPAGVTEAKVRVINNNPALGGNDFGLDDLSFGTMSVFFNVTTNSADILANQNGICEGTPIKDIILEYGGNGAPPTLVSGSLPAGVTATDYGRTFKISGVPTAGSGGTGEQTYTFTYQLSTSCGSRTVTQTIKVLAASKSGNIVGAPLISACTGATGTITLSGNVGSTFTWQTSTDSTVWTPAANGNWGPLSNEMWIRVAVQNQTCAADEFTVSKIGIKNRWNGKSSDEWTNIFNWSDRTIPTQSPTPCATTYIPVVPSARYPLITSGTAQVYNLDIQSGANVRILNNATLQIAGSITAPAAAINANDGTIEMNGSGAQNLAGSRFVGKNIEHLKVSGGTLNITSEAAPDTLNILEKLSFGNTSSDLNTGDRITLKSTAARTASVGVLNTDNVIGGRFTIERFVQHYGNWNMLTIPVRENISIRSSWQENGAALTSTGFGTRITGPATPPTPDLDGTSVGYSAKWWDNTLNSGAGNWVPVVYSTTDFVNRRQGYFLFVRGDRGIAPGAPGNTTTLRGSGTIFDANNLPSYSITAPVNTSVSLANPYASAIGFNKLYAANTGKIEPNFSVWDPTLWGLYGVGGYQTITASTGYKPTPGGSSIYSNGGSYPNVQSGQAIFVQTTTANPTINFAENFKEDGSLLVNRGSQTETINNVDPEQVVMLSTHLYAADGRIMDGNRVVFDDNYSDEVDYIDAKKYKNSYINFGLLRHNKDLAVEAKSSLKATDTLFYKMSGLPTGQFTIGVSVQNIVAPQLQAELIDNYLHTRTPVSLTDSTRINFTTTSDAASKAANRFMMVFRSTGVVLPVTFVQVAAQRNADRSIDVQWQVANEVNILRYEVERSADGQQFAGILTREAANYNTYRQTDLSPLAMDNFYRIKAIGLNGEILYSAIVKVAPDKSPALITVSPNPVKDKQLQVRFTKYAPGNYTILLSNALGQEIYRRGVTVQGSSFVKTISLQSTLAGGHYRLSVYDAEGNRLHSEALMVE